MYNKILALIAENKNIFITGSAGTGKSYILNQLQQALPNLYVTASTGVAAINVSGSTIHSFAGIGIGTKPAAQIAYSMRHEQRFKIATCKQLAIDEISMLSAETFDLINHVFKILKHTNNPFGGIQLIVIGDFLQLPPVAKDGKEVKFAFESEAWKEANYVPIHLEKQYRQNDDNFLADLNKIRFGEEIEMLSTSNHDEALHLFALNRPADEYNKAQLQKIKSQIHHFEAKDSGEKYHIEMINKNCLVPKNLYLKVGARVMLLINKFIDYGLINGSIGNVTGISSSIITVEFDNGKRLDLGYETVAKIMDGKFERASRLQIPLRLAYAISIHKAQGISLDKVYIDFSGTFECGQAYVALSRVRTKEGLSVKNLKPNLIKVNKKAIEFYRNLKWT